MEPKISIIVPVYKVEKYLDRCIQSIVDQTYRNLEIILVDDGSPDACPQICDEWASKDSRIKVIHQANGGMSAARNTGMKLATGEFLYFVDSDDFISENLCEIAIETFKRHQIDIVTFNCERITENGKRLGGTETIQNQILPSKKAIDELVQGHICDYVWNKVYRAYVFDGIWFPENRCFEDTAVMYQVFLKASQIYTMNEKLYFYQQRRGSMVSCVNIKFLSDLYQARKEQYMVLSIIYPDIAKKALNKVVRGAIAVYDYSLWEPGDAAILTDAKVFLQEHRDTILQEFPSFMRKLFFYSPKLYGTLRKTKHRIGNWVRRRKQE